MAPREPTTDERRMAYLRKCIAPMVKQLVQSQGTDAVLDALGMYDALADVEGGGLELLNT